MGGFGRSLLCLALMKILITSVLVVLLIISIVAWRTSRFAYESAPYTVIEADGKFEIREYPSITIVSTRMKNADPMEGGTFMTLFDYIAKGNEAEEKIAMTTPVFMTTGQDAEMSFVVPQEVAEAGAPAPKNESVDVKQLQMGKVAAYRYSGSWSQEAKDAAAEKLQTWVKEKGLSPAGDLMTAGYDPPFTPPFLRRNEVLVPVE